jgi:transcriptional regulator with XRE-family HTH domain
MPENRSTSRVALPHLRSWRAWRELTMEGLAAKAGVTRGTIYNLESGQAAANPVTVFRLAKALMITRQQLIEEEPPEETTEGQAVA